MCMFCAAVPVAASVGITITAKHKEKRREMLSRGQVPLHLSVSPGQATTAVVTVLIASAMIYHLAIGPRIGIY